jgi:hypothetical protein
MLIVQGGFIHRCIHCDLNKFTPYCIPFNKKIHLCSFIDRNFLIDKNYIYLWCTTQCFDMYIHGGMTSGASQHIYHLTIVFVSDEKI